MSEGRDAMNLSAPGWVRVGDQLSIALVAVLFLGGLLVHGYVSDGAARGSAWFACSILAAWSLLKLGLWKGSLRDYGPHVRRLLVTLVLLAAWTAFQLRPLPAEFVASLSPPWHDTLAAARGVGLDFGPRIPLAQNIEGGWRSWLQLLAYIMFLVGVFPLAMRRATATQLCRLVILVSILEGFFGLFNAALGGAEMRGRGPLYNPNHHAAAIALGLPLAMAAFSRIAREHDDDKPLLMLGMILVAVCGWLLSFSRGSVIATGLAMAGWVLYERRATPPEEPRGRVSPMRRLLPLLVVLLVAAGGLVTIWGTYKERFADQGHGAVDRLNLVRAAVRGLEESRFIGTGLGGAEQVLNRHLGRVTTSTPVHCHNDWMEVALETGLPGLAILAAGLGAGLVAWRRSWRFDEEHRKSPDGGLARRAALVGVCLTLIHALVDFHLRIPVIGFLFFTVLALAMQGGTVGRFRELR